MKGAKSAAPAELAAIGNLVKGAVGLMPKRGDVVAISSRPFVETAEVPSLSGMQPWFWPLVRQVGAVLGGAAGVSS